MSDQRQNMMVETRCIYCGAGVGKFMGSCPDNERHCHFCFKPESRESDPCIPGKDHSWRRGHEFQRLPAG